MGKGGKVGIPPRGSLICYLVMIEPLFTVTPLTPQKKHPLLSHVCTSYKK